MSSTSDKRRWALAVLLVPIATLLIFLLLVAVFSRGVFNKGENTGSINLFDVSLIQEQGQLFLNAQAQIELPITIKTALDSGVPLDFILTLRLQKPRTFWFDNTLAEFTQRYSLIYYELTRHYRVETHQVGIKRNYRSLYTALGGLGDFDRLPLFTEYTPESRTDLSYAINEDAAFVVAALEFKLDTQSLPLPLQPLITPSWRLASKEFVWPVN